MEHLEFVDEGHYLDPETGTNYMSIWTYKRKNGIFPNSNEVNYQDAHHLGNAEKYWGPFHVSNKFKSGWMYNEEDLNSYFGR